MSNTRNPSPAIVAETDRDGLHRLADVAINTDDPQVAPTSQMIAAPRSWVLLLHISIPPLTAAAPNGLRMLAKRGPVSDGFIVLIVVLVFILLAVCCFMSMCNLPIDPCGCCRSCSDGDDDDDDRRLGGPSSWLFKLSRGRYGAPPAPRTPPPPEFELKDVESEPQQWDGGYVHAGEPQGHHRRGRSHSQIFREALDVDRRPPAPPEAEQAAADRPKQGEVHRDAIDGWRKDVAGGGDQD